MQKISSSRPFIFEIQQSLESQTQKGHGHFWSNHPKIIKVIFGFSEYLSAYQKSLYSIKSFLRYSQF